MARPGTGIPQAAHRQLGASDPCPVFCHDVELDRLLTLVGVGWGILLILESATGATYPGVSFREVHDAEGPIAIFGLGGHLANARRRQDRILVR